MNDRIYLTSNIVENNTHVSALHSMIRKQLSKLDQTNTWHVNTKTCSRTPLRHSDLKCVRLIRPGYPVPDTGHQQLSYWNWQSWPESSHYITTYNKGNYGLTRLKSVLCYLWYCKNHYPQWSIFPFAFIRIVFFCTDFENMIKLLRKRPVL